MSFEQTDREEATSNHKIEQKNEELKNSHSVVFENFENLATNETSMNVKKNISEKLMRMKFIRLRLVLRTRIKLKAKTEFLHTVVYKRLNI